MGIAEMLVLAAGLAMDAFAVSKCKGLNMTKINYRHAGTIALFFGVFQAGMPLIGYALGTRFAKYIESFDHWVAFGLLAFIGGQMIFEAVKGDEEDDSEEEGDKLDIKQLFILAIATSIDALAIGITFALLNGISIWFSVAMIGVITFIISFFGVIIGKRFGNKY